MTKRNSTKQSLIASILVLCLCFTSLIGTTFAWFTDSVTSSGNMIQTGTLDVAMVWTDAKEDPTAATYKDASEGAIFKSDLWEPGYVEARHIKISNEGTLALKYKLLVVANGEVSDLSDVIDVYYYDPAVKLEERDALVGANKIGTLTEVLANFETTASGELEAGKEHTVTIALKMQETAGNEYQKKSIGSDFSIVLVATQVSSEDDSFDDKYDDNLEFPDVFIDSDAHDGEDETVLDTTNVDVVVPSTAEEGVYTLEASEPSKVADANGNTTVTFDITLKKDGVKVIDDGTVYSVSVNIGSGLNLTGITHNGNTVNVYSYDKVSGIVTFNTTHFSPFAFTYDLGEEAEDAEDLHELVANGGIIQLSCDVELTDAPIVVKKGQSVVLNLNGNTLSGKSTSSTTSYLIKVESGAELIIQDGTVSFYATTPDTEWGGEGQPAYPGYANNAVSASGTLIVNNAKVKNKTASGGASYCIDSYPGANVVVNEGSVIDGCGKIAIRMFANSDKTATNVTINGGTVTGYRAVWVQIPGAKPESKKIANLTVNGGTLESTDDVYNQAIYSYSYGDSFANTNITLNGGTFNGDVAMSGGVKTDRENVIVDWSKCTFEEGCNVFFYTANEPAYYVLVDTADELKAAVEAGNIAVLTADIDANADTAITVPSGVTAIVDLNGYTLAGTSSKTGNVDMFIVKGTLNVANGTVEIAALNNQGWSAMTTVFNVTAGGVLNIEEATVENLGGTDMAFCVHLNNWGEVTLNATKTEFKSNYVGIRAFNSGYDMNNITLTDCDILTGGSCLWVHNWTVADFGGDVDKAAAADARLNFTFDNVTVGRTNGSRSLIRYGFTDSIYYSDIDMTEVVAGAAAALQWALDNGKDVILNNDITLNAERSNAYGATGITVNNQTLDGNGYTLTVNKANGTWDSAIFIKSGTVKNITVKNAFRGIFTSDACNGDIYLDNVEFKDVVYTFNSDGTPNTREGSVYISNSKLNGWTSFSNTHEIVVFTNCTFGEGSGYAFCRPYNKTEFNSCVFEEGYSVDTSKTSELTFNNCSGI